MGEWVNKRSAKIIGWSATGLMSIAGIAAVYSLFIK
jgi:hypothetical protein